MKKINNKKILSYSVIIEKDPKSGYFSYAPDLPGCYSQGETIEKTNENMKESIELYLEVIRKNKKKIPISNFITLSSVSVTV